MNIERKFCFGAQAGNLSDHPRTMSIHPLCARDMVLSFPPIDIPVTYIIKAFVVHLGPNVRTEIFYMYKSFVQ